MDFGDLPRGGTAPASSKPRATGNGGINAVSMNVRPKTRAVDNDLYDTNLELKTNNRLKSNAGPNQRLTQDYGEMYFEDMEAVRASPIFAGELPDNSYQYRGMMGENGEGMIAKPPSTAAQAQPRAPSRNRVSKDPKRPQNNLVSGLSAYTQNIMVLHPTKKTHKASSAATSPRVPRDTKSNYMNDIRNAYGADLPFGKPSSPSRPKSKSSNSGDQPTIKQSDSYESDDKERPSNSAKQRKRSIGSNSALDGLHSTSASTQDDDFPAVRPSTTSYGTKPMASLKLPSGSSTPDNSNANSPSGRKGNKKSTPSGLGNLLKSSLTSKQPAAGGGMKMVDLDRSNVPSPMIMREDNSNANSAVTINSADYVDLVEVKVPASLHSGKSYENHPGEDDDHIHEEEELKRVISRDSSRRKSSPANMNTLGSNVDSEHIPQSAMYKVRSVSFNEEEEPFPATSNKDTHHHRHLGEKQTSVNSEELELLSNQRTSSTSSPDNVPTAKYTQLQSRMTPPNYRKDEEDNIDHYLDGNDDMCIEDHSSPQLLNLTTSGVISSVEQTSGDGSGSTPSRPQSRKLYLGNEKSPQPSPAIKAPRSAGARYAAHSPLKNGATDPLDVDGSKLKRLSSFNDLRQSNPWPKEEHLLNERPPSRQSSAFPVHLADEHSGKKRDNSTGNSSAAPANLRKNNDDVINSLTMQEQEKPVPANAINAKPIPPVLPNTEPRLIGKKAKLAIPTPATADTDSNTMAASPFDNRPPSRQKIAAQHLFDDGKGTGGQVPMSATGVGGRRPSGESRWQEANASYPKSAVPGTRALATRGGTGRSSMTYDPREDGFLELDPADNHMPFAISVSYGASADFAGSSSTSLNRRSARSTGNPNVGNDDIVNVMNEKFSEVSLISMTSGKDRSGRDGKKTVSSAKYNDYSNDASYGANYGLSPVRPKSVTTSNNAAKSGKVPATKAKSPIYYEHEGESEQLRSKSAGHYLSHARDRMLRSNNLEEVERIAPSTPTTTLKNSSKPNPRTKATSLNSGSAWLEQDPRNIPRAQNTFGLEADSGWTSPSLIAQPYTSSSPSNFMEYHEFSPQDDDDMTILTEDSGQNLDHSMSMQSFPLESSLGEDFLNLFAPGGR